MFKKLTIAILALLLAASALAQAKKRVAVFSFEDKTDHSYHWWDGRGPGEGMADMLTTALVKGGRYSVIERDKIASIMQEQQLGQSGMVTEQSAAQVGKLLGVELAVIGNVTEFGYSKKEMGGLLKSKGFGLGVASQKATIAVDVRFVNTTTGEIINSENVRKEQSAKGLSVQSPDLGFDNQSEFDNSLVGKATRAAIEDIVLMLDEQMGDMPWEGKIISVSGTTVYFKPGSDGGVKPGDVFVVYSKGEELIDPDTGLSLGSDETKAGTIEVTGFVGDGKASKAVIRSGNGIKAGDKVKQE
jgi:curli biogenesis system outer membrane secretion channel CsgG